ncbi:MAG TPA: hypothetical protein VJ723_12855 [Candidatus Angelobacter sp.]|nr:hypothetical protein [Candidatus Angelobacter sp.]
MMTKPRKWITVIMLAVGSISLGSIVLGAAIYCWKEYTPHFEAGALSSLRALQTMQENYKTEKGFYAGSFNELGVPLGAKLRGSVLTWDNGYKYQLSELSNDRSGRAIAYSIAARPIHYKGGSKKSYLMDQAGTVFTTTENRPANRSDHSETPTN